MDVDFVSKSPIDRSALSVGSRPATVEDGFAATMATQLDGGASTIERAERLLGARIGAPEGGCACDAFVASVAPSSSGALRADRPSDRGGSGGVAPAPVFAAPPAWSVSPGEILELDDPADLSSHLHRAILRNATEMITANRDGVVEVLSIPWDRVQRR